MKNGLITVEIERLEDANSLNVTLDNISAGEITLALVELGKIVSSRTNEPIENIVCEIYTRSVDLDKEQAELNKSNEALAEFEKYVGVSKDA